MNKLMIILDAGHGENTPGKRSPDGRLREYKWNRDFVLSLVKRLSFYDSIQVKILVPEEWDVPLSVRCARVNDTVKKNKKKGVDTILISIHVDAAKSDGSWTLLHGASAWIYKEGSERSVMLGKIYTENIRFLDLKGNKYSPADGANKSRFYILKNTSCPAILIEHGFMDSKTDIEFLLSDEGIERLLDLHESSILTYANYLNYELKK